MEIYFVPLVVWFVAAKIVGSHVVLAVKESSFVVSATTILSFAQTVGMPLTFAREKIVYFVTTVFKMEIVVLVVTDFALDVRMGRIVTTAADDTAKRLIARIVLWIVLLAIWSIVMIVVIRSAAVPVGRLASKAALASTKGQQR